MFDQIARKYGVMNYAMGGPVKMAEGGLTPEQYQSINAYLATNPSAEALASAQQQYGVSDADLAVARQFANVGAAPGTPGMDTIIFPFTLNHMPQAVPFRFLMGVAFSGSSASCLFLSSSSIFLFAK
jgi:hypothetical protein